MARYWRALPYAPLRDARARHTLVDRFNKIYEGISGPDDLLGRVARICQARRPHARVERIEISAKQGTGYLRVTESLGGLVSLYPVGVSAGTPGLPEVQGFCAEIDARYRVGDASLTSYLVYDGEPANDDLRKWAAMRGVALQSLLEFQGVHDLRPYAARQVERLSGSDIYPPEPYVTQRFRAFSGGGRNVTEPEEDLLTRLQELASDHNGRFIVVLGDFGYGKTFLLRELTRRIHEQKMPPVIPILIQLRDLEKAHSLDQLLAAQLTIGGEEVIDHRLLRYLVSEGRVLLLFDGFDELALRVTYDQAAEHLDTLVRAAEGRAKVVLTSRTQYFLSDRQVETALGSRISEPQAGCC